MPTMRKRQSHVTLLVAATLALFGLVLPGRAGADGAPLTDEILEPGLSLPDVSPDVRDVVVRNAATWDPETGTFAQGPPQLQFDSWIQNVGSFPLELVGDEPKYPTTAMQCVAWTANRICRETRVVEGYVWDNSIGGFRFPDFANYELRRLLRNGRVDFSNRGLVATNAREAFCLIDSALVDQQKPAPPHYFMCGETMHGISPGWATLNESGMPGQELPIETLTDGRYALVVTLDRAGHLFDADETNDTLVVTVELSAGITEAAIVGRHYQ